MAAFLHKAERGDVVPTAAGAPPHGEIALIDHNSWRRAGGIQLRRILVYGQLLAHVLKPHEKINGVDLLPLGIPRLPGACRILWALVLQCRRLSFDLKLL
jgi:hypothetical protein